MSSTNLAKLAQQILTRLEKTTEHGVASSRRALVKQQGQILLVNRNVFLLELSKLFPSLNDEAKSRIWSKWDKILRGQQSNVKPTRRLKQLQEDAASLITSDSVYIINSYETVRRLKGSKLLEIVSAEIADSEKDSLKLIGGSSNAAGFQLGHGEGEGVAASSVRVLNAAQIASKAKLSPSDNALISRIFSEYKQKIAISIAHEQILTNAGKLRKSYIPIITWQTALENQEVKGIEEEAIVAFKQQLINMATFESSTNLRDAIEQVTFYNVAPIKRDNVTITGIRKKQLAEKSSGRGTKIIKRKRANTVVRDSTVGFTIAEQKEDQINLISIVNLINQDLPNEVKARMRPPALVNRTGTFAASVRVTDAAVTPKGFPSFGYTYQGNPYQVFDMGRGRFPWATPERDPRTLIEGAIRSIATKLIDGRFFLRRV